MFRRLLTILIWVIAIAAIAVVWVRKPVYRSTGAVQVATNVPPLIHMDREPCSRQKSESPLHTQAFLLRSSGILERVLADPKVQESRWYTRVAGCGAECRLERLRNSLHVEVVPHTEIIRVSCDAGDARDAQLLVDTTLRALKESHDDMLHQTDGGLLETLNRERMTLEKEIAGLAATRYNIAKRLGGEQGVKAMLDRYHTWATERRSEKRQLEHNLKMNQWELRQLHDADATSASAPTPATKPSSSPGQNKEAELERAIARIEYEISLVEQEIEDLAATMSDLGDMYLEDQAYEEQIARKTKLVERLRNRQQTLDLETGNVRPRITIVEHGNVPARPHREDRAVATGGIFLGALVLTILLRIKAARPRR